MSGDAPGTDGEGEMAAKAPKQREQVSAVEAVAVVTTMLLNFLYAGIIFGWASIQLLLEDDGVYAGLCAIGERTCPQRTDRFVYLYTLGSTLGVLGGGPHGFLVDWLGPTKCFCLSGAGCVAGLLLFGFAEPGSSADAIDGLAVGSMLIGCGGCLILVTSMPMGFVVPPRYLPLVLTGVNCCFDSSSVIPLGLYQMYKTLGWSRQAVFTMHAVLCLVLHCVEVSAWCFGPAQKLRLRKAKELEDSKAPANEDGRPDRPVLHGLPLRRQLRSLEGAFGAVVLTVQVFRSNMYLGTNKNLLEQYGDPATGYAYTQLFNLSLPLSSCFGPLIDRCLRSRGFGDTFLLVFVLGTMWNVTALVPVLEVQPLSFFAYTNFRAILYAAYFTFLAHSFGSRTSGRAHGVFAIAAGLANFLIWPSVDLALAVDAGDLRGLYFFSLTLCAAPATVTVLLRRRLRHYPAGDCRIVEAAAAQPSPVAYGQHEDAAGGSGATV